MSAHPFRRLTAPRPVLLSGSMAGLLAVLLLAAAAAPVAAPPPESVVASRPPTVDSPSARPASGAESPERKPAVIERKAPRAGRDFADERYYKAHFLETQQRDYAAAADLFAQIARDRGAAAELREAAAARAAGCREELACDDFAKLVPAGTLAYVEFSRPGEQLSGLLAQLGLLREGGTALSGAAGQVGISRTVVEGLLGLRGAAAAITGFDPSQGKPAGVAILHPGEMEVLRALIQDALNAAATPVEAIGGYPTYCIENEVFLTFTARLIVVSQQRGEIEGVLRRLSGDDDESLRSDPSMAAALADRDGALLFFALNFKPVLPLIQAAMAVGGAQSPELAVAQALLDPASLDTLVGHVSVRDEGLRIDLALRLADENRNLAFHFLRLPPIDRRTLARVPAGCAGFFALALSEAGDTLAPVAVEVDPRVPPAPVSMLDLGRELYANIVGVAGFVPTGITMQIDRERLPAAALVFTVRDPRRSRALWTELLGVASLATRSGPLDGARVDIEGVSAQRFDLPEGISVYLAQSKNDVLLSPSKEAIAAALRASTDGQSVLNDPAYSNSLSRIGDASTIALFAHAGRCIEIARPMMGEHDAAEAAPFLDAASDLVGSLVVDHSPNTLRISLMATGLPQVGPILTELLHRQHSRTRTRFVHEVDEHRPLPIVRHPHELERKESQE